MEDSQLPSPMGTQLLVDVRGAEIVSSSSDDPDVYLPMHEEMISHIALDIGGSLAKVVYFTRAPKPKAGSALSHELGNGHRIPTQIQSPSPPSSPAKQPNGILGPTSLSHRRPMIASYDESAVASTSSSSPPPPITTNSTGGNKDAVSGSRSGSEPGPGSSYPPFQHARRRSSTSKIPSGGRLNFIKFETTDLDSCIHFLSTLISSSAASNRVPLEVMKKNVKIMATGGGAHKFYKRLRDELGVEVRREEEMECLVLGLGFVMEVPNEVFWYSDELVQAISHPNQQQQQQPQQLTSSSTTSLSKTTSSAVPATGPPASEMTPSSLSFFPPLDPTDPFPRPSPNPPQYSLSFDESPCPAQFPCLLVNIGSGVSIIKVDDYGKFERISGTSLGGGTLWGLLSLLTGAKSFDDMLSLADKGDNSSVDMLVGDIYGQDYQKIGLKSSTIASSFGKVFRKDGSSPTSLSGVETTTNTHNTHESGGSNNKHNIEDTAATKTSLGTGVGESDAEEETNGASLPSKKAFKPEDISRSLLYAISNNIGQIAYMNAEKHNLDRIYFGGGFIRGHAATISTLSYAIRFWSKGTKRALFLRHEGYLGGIGAWLKNLSEGGDKIS